jgi:DNA-directed RNA polymerase specialized sigma24 family protein
MQKKIHLLVSIAKEIKLPVALVKEILVYTLKPVEQENIGLLFSSTPINKNLFSPPPTERKVIELFYGYGTKRHSIIEIADLKNLTEHTVKTMISSGLTKLMILL